MAGSIFQFYSNKLTDLSSRNKSLYIPKTEGNGVLDLQELDFLNGETAFEILRKAILGKKKISLIPEVDPRLGEVNRISKLLSKIAFRDQLIQEETGDQSLFLAWPFLEGKMMNGKILRAPLLLLPCKLEKEAQNWTLVPTDTWQLNSALILAYSHGYQVKFDSETLQEQFQDLSSDPIEFRIGITKLLEANFPFQLSSTLFEDRITSFPNSQVSVDSSKFQDGKVVLKTYALLGQFAQKGNFLFRDYEDLQTQDGSDSLETLFVNHFHQEEGPVPREDQLFSVFPLDASQENVLLKVRQGKSLVVQGPPGTGKSQLIANLVSDYTARGKKVLVVSQKRAALDVVFERMANAGFGEFLGLIHDFRADQKLLFQKIKSQIESIESYQDENRGLDSMQLEREISVLSKTISRLSKKFEQFRTLLFESESVGIPVKAMYLNVGGFRKTSINSKSELLSLNFEEAREFEKEFKLFKSYQERFKDSFWAERISFSGLGPGHYSQISELIQTLENYKIPAYAASWNFESFRKFQLDIIHGGSFLEKTNSLKSSLNELENGSFAIRMAIFTEERKKALELQNWIKKSLPKLQESQFSIPKNQERLSEEFESLSIVQSSWFGKITLGLKKSRFPNLVSWLEMNGLVFNSTNLETSKTSFDLFQVLETELLSLSKPEGMTVSLGQLNQVSTLISDSETWVTQWTKVPNLDSLCDWETKSANRLEFLEELDSFYRFLMEFESEVQSWKIYLTSSQIRSLLFEKGKVSNPNLLQTFSELVAFDQFLEKWDPQRIKLAEKILQNDSSLSLEENLSVFWNSWYLTWIGELERRNPVLAEAGSLKLKQEMLELKDAILEKRKISKFMTLLRLRERMTGSLELNRLGNRLTYRELLRQVSKKRQKWPIRKLVEGFESEIFRLIPCWLASPESVSALFPMVQSFDLVIFDEASQCPVERGLPAMLRGKQVVVAGDSKQLQPSDFYQVKWESEEEGIEYEAESLLELAGNFFEKAILTGHYRSADPGLIHFSNRNFYEGKLEVLPDLATVLAGKSPFSWDKIEGVWENQINKSEADAVVERVKEIQSASPEDTIGIVTGNYFQMELIREKLWKAGIQHADIKVRNIENVQGDEFDQVILSLGYASNREGKLITNFGLLGKFGSENRLNVAITRARKRMHVISSIAPEDFRPGQLKNPGLALFREFLLFVQKQSKNPSLEVMEVFSSGYEIDWSLKRHLMKRSYSFTDKVPSTVMDLLKSDAGNTSAILTDDQRFFNSPTAKAVMAYHPILLEAKGWEWEWKWSREEIMKKGGSLQ
ncbi:MAG: hypothetical protein ACI9ZX_000152 [Algoriphagus sp.]|jgi:hypothetical protein